jgi:hypothetical protein
VARLFVPWRALERISTLNVTGFSADAETLSSDTKDDHIELSVGSSDLDSGDSDSPDLKTMLEDFGAEVALKLRPVDFLASKREILHKTLKAIDRKVLSCCKELLDIDKVSSSARFPLACVQREGSKRSLG